MAFEGLQLELREALRLVARRPAESNERDRPLLIRARWRDAPGAPERAATARPDAAIPIKLLLISFQELPASPAGSAARAGRGAQAARQDFGAGTALRDLERELQPAPRRAERAMLEEQQVSNEELKSTNEELQSTNEELQSTNEEMETSKEELQSVNEELVTVNAELQIKVEQMAGMQDDMKNLLDNIRLGTIFLDRQG
jgi:two-component system CheB/CheR fusion protein